MPEIKLVLFDMDNVLCAYDRMARATRLAEICGSTPERVYEAIWTSGFERLGDSGALDAQAYLKGFGERLGYPLSLDQWLDARRAATVPDPVMLELVGDVRRLSNVAILTNNSELLVDNMGVFLPTVQAALGPHIFASARFKSAKPDEECYRRCLSELQVAPHHVLFVDDLPENVEGARAAGLFAHHFTAPEGLRDDLKGYTLTR